MPGETIRLLFVCSGNTCRSPMAAAIAEHFARARRADLPAIEVDSAGTGVSEGAPVTPEAARALARLGVDAVAHRSRSLSRAQIDASDAIYCMTPAHLEAVLALAPDAAYKARLLDPAGGSVPDPIGGSQRLYNDVCRTLADLIAARMQELDG